MGALVPVRYRPGAGIPLVDVSWLEYLPPVVFAVLGTVLASFGLSVLMGGNPSWW